MVERNGVDVLVEDEGEGNDEVEDVEALRTQAVRENFDGVGDDEWCESKTNSEKLVYVR